MQRHNRYPESFAFRLETDVAHRLRKVAAAHGYKPAEWARKIISEVVGVEFIRRSVRLRVLHADILGGYLRELSMQGNNINQIARALNRREDLAVDDLARELEAVRQQNQTMLLAIIDALGADEMP